MAQRLYRRVSLWDKEIVQTTTTYWVGLCKSKSSTKTVSLGSNPSKATMRIRFKYNGIIYYPKDLDKKLKQLGISINDIEIIDKEEQKEEQKEEEIDTSIKKYYFKNVKTGEIIVSTYPDLRNLENIINVNGYERC